MKGIIKTLVILISILIITVPLYAKDGKNKIGYVDLYKVFDKYHKTQKSGDDLEKKAISKNAEKDSLWDLRRYHAHWLDISKNTLNVRTHCNPFAVGRQSPVVSMSTRPDGPSNSKRKKAS